MQRQLLVFGDSVMKGVTLINGRYKLSRSLSFENFSENGTDVKNYSKMGATVDYIKKAIAKHIEEIKKDDMVLLGFGGNDADFDWEKISENPTALHPPKTPLKPFSEEYKNIISLLKERGALVFVCTLLPVDSEKYFEFITKNRNKENILFWLGDKSILSRFEENYNLNILKMARETDCAVVNTRSEFLLSHEFSSLLSSDGIHPTDKGYSLISQTVFASLSKYL